VEERVLRIRFEPPTVRDAFECSITEIKQKVAGTRAAVTGCHPIGWLIRELITPHDLIEFTGVCFCNPRSHPGDGQRDGAIDRPWCFAFEQPPDGKRMIKKCVMLEIGMGTDLRGADRTNAACRAIRSGTTRQSRPRLVIRCGCQLVGATRPSCRLRRRSRSVGSFVGKASLVAKATIEQNCQPRRRRTLRPPQSG
jgi:hypothetical protein